MNIVLIGAGNVATHLGQALAKAGHQILQVYSRTETSAVALTEKLNAMSNESNKSNESAVSNESNVSAVNAMNAENAIHSKWTTQIDEVNPTADLYLVMLKDSILDTVLPQLVKRNPHALYVHTAGSVPMNIWAGLATRYGVLYPMQTFSKASTVDFSQVHFFVEANTPGDTEQLKTLARGISDHVYEATSEQRKYLHLSAVFACNFTNHMYAICNELLTSHGLPFSSMFPLIDETARKVHHLNPKAAQTGPAQRNDRNVMQQQEALLSAHPLQGNAMTADPALAEIYRLISEHIVSYQKQYETEAAKQTETAKQAEAAKQTETAKQTNQH